MQGTDMQEPEKNLMGVRVQTREGLRYRAAILTEEERTERRYLLRKALKETSYRNLSNEELDSVRLWEEPSRYILEDGEGRLFSVPLRKGNKRNGGFQKVRGIPFEFLNLTGKDFDWTCYGKGTDFQKECVNSFILKFNQFQEKGMGLYIHSGTKGSGKTMLACCILNELCTRYPVSVKFIHALDFLEITKKSFRGQEAEEQQALYNASVLAVDDIGKTVGKEGTKAFSGLINARCKNRLVTIYTSSAPLGSLKMKENIIDQIESTTYNIALPEISVRSRIREQKKREIMEQIKAGV